MSGWRGAVNARDDVWSYTDQLSITCHIAGEKTVQLDMATTSTGTPSDAVPMTREELKETVASTICCHTRMSPAVQWEIDLLMGAIDKHVDLRLSQVQALCTQLPPNMPDPIETAVAHTAGWNDAMDKVQDALTRSGAPTEPRRVRP